MKKLANFFILFTVLSIHIASAQIKVTELVRKTYNSIPYPTNMNGTYDSGYIPGEVTLNDGTKIKGELCFFKKNDKVFKLKAKITEPEKKKIEIKIEDVAFVDIDELKNYERDNDYKEPSKNFNKGYVVDLNGVKYHGKVAIDLGLLDFKFFTKKIFFLPEKGDTATAFVGMLLAEVGQEIDGKLTIYDGYMNGYLYRILDGKLRLSRNPYPSTKPNAFLKYVVHETSDEISKEAAGLAFAMGGTSRDMRNNYNATMDSYYQLGNIEFKQLEYLVYNTETKEINPVGSKTYKDFVASLSSTCSDFGKKEEKEKKDLLAWSHIEKFIQYYNENCK